MMTSCGADHELPSACVSTRPRGVTASHAALARCSLARGSPGLAVIDPLVPLDLHVLCVQIQKVNGEQLEVAIADRQTPLIVDFFVSPLLRKGLGLTAFGGWGRGRGGWPCERPAVDGPHPHRGAQGLTHSHETTAGLRTSGVGARDTKPLVRPLLPDAQCCTMCECHLRAGRVALCLHTSRHSGCSLAPCRGAVLHTPCCPHAACCPCRAVCRCGRCGLQATWCGPCLLLAQELEKVGGRGGVPG